VRQPSDAGHGQISGACRRSAPLRPVRIRLLRGRSASAARCCAFVPALRIVAGAFARKLERRVESPLLPVWQMRLRDRHRGRV